MYAIEVAKLHVLSSYNIIMAKHSRNDNDTNNSQFQTKYINQCPHKYLNVIFVLLINETKMI